MIGKLEEQISSHDYVGKNKLYDIVYLLQYKCEHITSELEKLKQDYIEPRKKEWDYSVIGANTMIDEAIKIVKENLTAEGKTLRQEQ